MLKNRRIVLASQFAALSLSATSFACARATPAARTSAAMPAAAAGRVTPCPLPVRDTLGGRLGFVAYVLDGALLQPYARQIVGGGRGTWALDTLPAIAALSPSEVVEVDVRRGSDAVARYAVCPGATVVAITTKRPARRRDERRPRLARPFGSD